MLNRVKLLQTTVSTVKKSGCPLENFYPGCVIFNLDGAMLSSFVNWRGKLEVFAREAERVAKKTHAVYQKMGVSSTVRLT